MIYYAKHFESNKTMNFKISDKKLLKKYTQIWKKSWKFIQYKIWYSDNDKCIKTKINIYDGNVNTNIQGAEVPKENASYKCLPLIMLDSVVR